MLYEVFVLASISCKEGVACGVQFCMKSLFWRQSVVRRVCLAFNTLSQYSDMKSLLWRQSVAGRVWLVVYSSV